MGLTTTNTQNYDFLFSSRETSSAEKTAQNGQSFLNAVRQAGGAAETEQTQREKMADIRETISQIKSGYKLGGDAWLQFLQNLYEDNELRKESYRLAAVGNNSLPRGYTNINGEFVEYIK